MNFKAVFVLSFVCLTFACGAARADGTAFPTFGIAFTPPNQTSFNLTASPGCVALYEFDKTSACPGAAICVEWAPARGSSADDVAQSMAKDHGGTILPGAVTIGGEKAVKVSADFAIDGFTKRITYLAKHGDFVYMVSEFNTATADASNALAAFLPTVSFSPPESPAKHLDELTESAWIMFGSCSMKFPRCARKFDSEQNILNVGINDLSTSKLGQPFSVDVEPVQVANPVSFAAIQAAYSAGMAKAMSLPADKPFTWNAQAGTPGLNVSNVLAIAAKLPDGTTANSSVRLAVLELAPGNFVQFVFSFSAPADSYAHLSDEMLKTLKVLPPAGK